MPITQTLTELSSLRWALTVDKNLSPCQLKLLLKTLMYNLDYNLRMGDPGPWQPLSEVGKEALEELTEPNRPSRID